MHRNWKRRVSRGALIAGLLVGAGAISPAAAGNCIFEDGESDPYYVLGSRVQQQSSILLVGDCSATFEQLDASYASNAKAHRSPESEGRWITTAHGCVYHERRKGDCPTDSP